MQSRWLGCSYQAAVLEEHELNSAANQIINLQTKFLSVRTMQSLISYLSQCAQAHFKSLRGLAKIFHTASIWNTAINPCSVLLNSEKKKQVSGEPRTRAVKFKEILTCYQKKKMLTCDRSDFCFAQPACLSFSVLCSVSCCYSSSFSWVSSITSWSQLPVCWRQPVRVLQWRDFLWQCKERFFLSAVWFKTEQNKNVHHSETSRWQNDNIKNKKCTNGSKICSKVQKKNEFFNGFQIPTVIMKIGIWLSNFPLTISTTLSPCFIADRGGINCQTNKTMPPLSHGG
jgi:hypothetical protein